MKFIETNMYGVNYLDERKAVVRRTAFAAENKIHARAVAAVEAPESATSVEIWELRAQHCQTVALDGKEAGTLKTALAHLHAKDFTAYGAGGPELVEPNGKDPLHAVK